jgi:hypothetical protein
MAAKRRDRDDPLGGLHVEEAKRKPRKHPRYKSEEERVKGTWDLKPETLERIRVLAEKLEVAQYTLVEKALGDWLDLYEAGEVQLKKVPVVARWELE